MNVALGIKVLSRDSGAGRPAAPSFVSSLIWLRTLLYKRLIGLLTVFFGNIRPDTCSPLPAAQLHGFLEKQPVGVGSGQEKVYGHFAPIRGDFVQPGGV